MTSDHKPTLAEAVGAACAKIQKYVDYNDGMSPVALGHLRHSLMEALARHDADLEQVRRDWPPMGLTDELRKGEPERGTIQWIRWYVGMVYQHGRYISPGDARLATEVVDDLIARHDAATEASPAAGDDKLRRLREWIRDDGEERGIYPTHIRVRDKIDELLGEPETPSDPEACLDCERVIDIVNKAGIIGPKDWDRAPEAVEMLAETCDVLAREAREPEPQEPGEPDEVEAWRARMQHECNTIGWTVGASERANTGIDEAVRMLRERDERIAELREERQKYASESQRQYARAEAAEKALAEAVELLAQMQEDANSWHTRETMDNVATFLAKHGEAGDE